MRDGVYVLPNSKSARAVFEEQAEEVVAAGGAAHILPLDTHEAAQQREFARLFDRGADYAELFARLAGLKAGTAKLDEVEARRQAAALRRDVAALSAIDFFPGPARSQVESLLTDTEAALNARFSRRTARCQGRDSEARTRPLSRAHLGDAPAPVWIDRVASAWLIRRFIDPESQIRLAEKKPAIARKLQSDSISDGAEFTPRRRTRDVRGAGCELWPRRETAR